MLVDLLEKLIPAEGRTAVGRTTHTNKSGERMSYHSDCPLGVNFDDLPLIAFKQHGRFLYFSGK